jgi:3'-5' exonuclease
MLNLVIKENILFLDVETVPQYAAYNELPVATMKLWDHKTEYLKKPEGATPEKLYERAGIYAEFGKIVCISVGFFYEDKFRVKSFAGEDERLLLNDFAAMLGKDYFKSNRLLCAHNGKEFDFPYIARRMLIHRIKLPALLNQSGKKPWEVPHLDTMELWRFGDYKSYTSLELLANIFDIPTPKDDIKGSDVGKVFWQDKDISRIARYCEKDVVTIARLFLCYRGEDVFSDEAVEVAGLENSEQ